MNKTVKCLRCGCPMNESDIRCPHCHHYYENRVNGVNSSHNMESNSLNITYSNSKLASIIIIVIVLSTFFVAYYMISRENKKIKDFYDNYNMDKNSEEYRICTIKCENMLYLIRDNKCICTNGNEYDIN